jgi:energy-coupling factor transporter ATP-binding protein EcfA2
LAQRGITMQRFATQKAMIDRLVIESVRTMMRELPDQSGQLPFKRVMEVYDYGDPMPLPDRIQLRRELQEALLAYGGKGEMLVLEGPSGCGKSSLLRKGLLDNLPSQLDGAHVILLRPNELLTHEGRWPFEKLIRIIGGELIRAGLGDFTQLGRVGGSNLQAVADIAASEIGAALLAANSILVIAIDQFEDVIDYIEVEEDALEKPRSWWQILRFLGAAAKQKNIYIVGTLENQRLSRVDSLSLRDRTSLCIQRVNVDFPIGGVGNFVRMAAENARLPLSDEIIIKIQTMVEDFERNRRLREETPSNASFLPLLGLWLARLFEKFQDRMGSSGSSVSQAMKGSIDTIRPDDLIDRGIPIEFDGLIAELVDAAWIESRQVEYKKIGEKIKVADQRALFSFLGDDRHPSEIKTIINSSMSRRKGINLQYLMTRLSKFMPQGVPGLAIGQIIRPFPNKSSLNNFLSPLIAIDEKGNPRLLSGPADSPIDSLARLIRAHLRRRLLVPSGQNKLQFVHQAVIDNWQHGRKWLEINTPILKIQRKIQLYYEEAKDRMETDEICISKAAAVMAIEKPETVIEAARLLRHYRIRWNQSFGAQPDHYDITLRDFCLALIETAEDGGMPFLTSDDKTTYLIHIAAAYDRVEVIERWIEKNNDLANLRTKVDGDTPLSQASWGAASSVQTLLKHNAEPKLANEDGWHPIAATFQNRDLKIFNRLIGYYDVSSVVGPEGQTILHLAAGAEKPDFLIRLIDSTEDVDLPDENGFTPLMYAAGNGRVSQVIMLLDHHARPNVTDNNRCTILHHATAADRAETIISILNHGNISSWDRMALLTHEGLKDVVGITPLAMAAQNAMPSALAALLSHCDPADSCHRVDDLHPITLLTRSNIRSEGGEPLADRVSLCAALLLEKGGILNADLVQARESAVDFPDVCRQIDEHLTHKGNLADIPDSQLLNFLLSRSIQLAEAVLRHAPQLLDKFDDEGYRIADLFLQRGHTQAIFIACAVPFRRWTKAPKG